MGFFDLLNPVFTGIETYLLSWMPAWARVSLWGLVSGVVTMLLYAKVSNQDALTEGKQASKEALAAMRTLDPEADMDVVFATMRRAIAAPLRQTKNAAVPALWASLPIIFVLVWMGSTYSYQAPPIGSSIVATVEPFAEFWESDSVHRNEEQTYSLTWPESGQIELQGLGDDFAVSIPSSTLVPVIHKRKWWNWLIGNPAGYIDDSAPIDSVEFTHAPRELVAFGPGWLRSWLFFYFAVLMASAIAIKVKFKIA